MSELYQGKDFQALCAMMRPEDNEDWETTFPLLVPLLAAPDTPTRKVAVALMRTFGKDVRRKGGGYVLIPNKERVRCPVTLQLEAVGEFKMVRPMNIIVRETATRDEKAFSVKGSIGWTFDGYKLGTSMSAGPFGIWDEVKIPRTDFIGLKKDQEFKSTHDVSSYLDRPGKYKVSVRKCYPHDGGDLGLDAWTGAAFSETIEIEVVE